MADSPIRSAAVLATGEELVRGAVIDTNSAWLARRLRGCGVTVAEIRVVSDSQEAVRAAILDLSARVDLLVVTGGLGPTPDDRTRDALASAAGVPLERDAGCAERMAARLGALGRKPSPSNERQALLPRGGAPIENPIGSAAGIEIAIGGARVVALPGVPAELRAMVDGSLLPRVRAAAAGPPIAERLLQVAGLPESVAGERIAAWMAAPGPPLVSDTVRDGVITICASDRDDAAGRARLESCVAEMRAALGDHVFSGRDETLAEFVVAELRRQSATVAIAESCTGGMVAAALTDVAGCSDVLPEACVTYVDAAKRRSLRIAAGLLERCGAVSEEVARAMAAGVRERAGTTFGLSVTGIAGPGGGAPGKPVGLVHVAVRGPRGELHARRIHPGDRGSIRRSAVTGALDLLRRALR